MSEPYKPTDKEQRDADIALILGRFNKLDMIAQMKALQSTIDEITALFSHGVCEDCRWWINNEECELRGRNGVGGCGDWHDVKTGTYGTGSSSDSGLITEPDFYCRDFEPRVKP